MTTRRDLLIGICATSIGTLVNPMRAIAAQAAAQPPSTLKITGDVRTPLSLAPDEVKAMPRTRVEVKDEDGRTIAYEGVLVGDLLKRAGATLGGDLRGNAVATYVVASASDG